jgi:hypothetical protein
MDIEHGVSEFLPLVGQLPEDFVVVRDVEASFSLGLGISFWDWESSSLGRVTFSWDLVISCEDSLAHWRERR